MERNELYILCTKIIFPAFVAVGVKIAIEMKKNKMKISVFNAISSITIGVGSAYLTSDYVIANCDKDNVSIVIALIAITSDKIGEFLIYKLNIEGLIKSIIDSLILGIKK